MTATKKKRYGRRLKKAIVAALPFICFGAIVGWAAYADVRAESGDSPLLLALIIGGMGLLLGMIVAITTWTMHRPAIRRKEP